MASITDNERSLRSDNSSIQQSLEGIDAQASKVYTNWSSNEYEKLQSQIKTLSSSEDFRTAWRSEAVSPTEQASRLNGDPDLDGRILPLYEKEQYKHQVLLAWWAVCNGDKPAEINKKEKEKLWERAKLECYFVTLNNNRGDNVLKASELSDVSNGIIRALVHHSVPEPVFQVLATLRHHRERFQSQNAETATDLMRTISTLLERRYRARRPLP